jgi:hypothetical protein
MANPKKFITPHLQRYFSKVYLDSKCRIHFPLLLVLYSLRNNNYFDTPGKASNAYWVELQQESTRQHNRPDKL